MKELDELEIVDAAEATFDKLIDEKKYKEVINFAEQHKDDFDGLGMMFYLRSGFAHYQLGDYQKSIDICDEVMAFYKEQANKNLATWALYIKYSRMHKAINSFNNYYCDNNEIRAYSLLVSKTIPKDWFREDDVQVAKDAKKDFKKYDKRYARKFLTLPYEKRKFLLPVKKYTSLEDTTHCTISLARLSKMDIIFPAGHPIADQMYVAHPSIYNKYITLEEYDTDLTRSCQ